MTRDELLARVESLTTATELTRFMGELMGMIATEAVTPKDANAALRAAGRRLKATERKLKGR